MKYGASSATQKGRASVVPDIPLPVPIAIVRDAKDRAKAREKRRQLLIEISLAGFVLVFVSIVSFYNLGQCPAMWRDEGGALLLARTLASDGVYAVKNYDRNGSFYDTFGPVQSVGPTVILPIAVLIRLSGYDLGRARLIAAAYLVVTVVLFYFVARRLFGWKTALLSALLLFSSPSTDLIHWGRQAMAEVPALTFFLGGWLAWSSAYRRRKNWLYVVAGILFGAAIVTKTHYLIIGTMTMALLGIADLLWYRLRLVRGLLAVGSIAALCNASWWGWQLIYFGRSPFFQNMAKIQQLAAATGGFNLHVAGNAIKQLFGFESQLGHFYFFWGVPALVYAAGRCFNRDEDSVMEFSLLCFASAWLAYWVLWITPWPQYGLPAFAITALFVGKLWSTIAQFSLRGLKREIAEGHPGRESIGVAITVLVALTIAFSMVSVARNNVLRIKPRWFIPAAEYLDRNVPTNSVIEIWDRELALMTPHHYHITDPMLLQNARTPYVPPSGSSLGSEYFESYRPDYVMVGPLASSGKLYDTDYLSRRAVAITTIGTGEENCVLYRMAWH